jgi:hypothetical protein
MSSSMGRRGRSTAVVVADAVVVGLADGGRALAAGSELPHADTASAIAIRAREVVMMVVFTSAFLGVDR